MVPNFLYGTKLSVHFQCPFLPPLGSYSGLDTRLDEGVGRGPNLDNSDPEFLNFYGAVIDSKKPIPPAYVASRAGTITLFLLVS